MKKVGQFFFSFLPAISAVTLQFMIMIPMTGFALIRIFQSSADYSDLESNMDLIFSNSDFTNIVSILYAVCGIFLFGMWYQKQFQGNVTKNVQKWMNAQLLMGTVCIAPILQIATGVLISGVSIVFPAWMEKYTQLMDAAGLSENPTFLLVMYAVIFGPICEELTFRGITLASFKRVLPFWAANFMQALLFGIFHMNMIQGIYAFFIGLIFGYICEKSRCIWYSIALHIVFNFMGTFSGTLINDNTPAIIACLTFLIYIFLGISGLWLIAHNLPEKEKIASFSKEIDRESDI